MASQPHETPWWRGAVIYQIYPRSFADSNDDGIGDLAGITAHLEHVASLGVDAIWLSPFFASPMTDFGYDVSDYRAVDPMFGTLEDFDALLARAHELGLKVIIDQVYAHTSDQHAWFRESRAMREGDKSDWYVWADPKPDGTPPNNWLSVFYGPCWSWDGRRGQYYLHNFLPSQPNLNVHNPDVQQALFDTARFWLDRGVDGFRLDAINFAMHDPMLTDNPPVTAKTAVLRRPFDYQHHIHNQSQPELMDFVEKLARVVRDYPGERFTVAEVGGEQALTEMKTLTAGNDLLHTSYGFDFLYAEKLTPKLILSTLEKWSHEEGEGWPSWAFSNHDAPRAVSRWGDGAHQDGWARLLLALLMSLRGNVFLYQGEELGLNQAQIPFERLRDPEAIANWPLTLGRDGARTPMPWAAGQPHGGFSQAEPWLPVPGDHITHAVSVQNADPDSILALARRLVRLRRDTPALRCGDFVPLSLKPPLLGFERLFGDQRVRCLFNLGLQPAAIKSGGDKVLCAHNADTLGTLGPLGFSLQLCSGKPQSA
ncbi:MAG: alpha-glucosidase [Alphaproteobacteria bacterium]|nr:alpha-glucosidase [Alphaproteobacteria bacterium]